MANEITVQSSLTINPVSGGLPALKHGGDAQRFDQTTKNKVAGRIACTTTPAAITLTALTAKAWCYFENLDTTNAVIIDADDGTGVSDAFHIPAGSGYVVYLANASTYQARSAASTATLIFEAYDA